MRIAVDIDSTLHHYWDDLSAAAQRRFGIDLPYEEQFTWGITRLKEEQLACCVQETHSEEVILAAEPYPGAVETVNGWHAAGHFIHVTSHRDPRAHDATERWLRAIGLQYDELYCSDDKIARCREIAIDLLIDDAPQNLQRAAEHGILAATLLHPWNEDVVAEEGIIAGRDWPELARRLEERVDALRRQAA
jgi:hypothetical protein